MQELATTKKFNILIVDDENVIANTLAIAFSKNG
jgi:DNA-binding response OmpR family regulator